MKQIRSGVFETNSSSTHSLVIGKLTEDQVKIDYKFPSISLRPVHFGYNDIVAPSVYSNNFPSLRELCKGCEYLKCENNNCGDGECTNPDYMTLSKNKWWLGDYDEKCQRYINAKADMMEKIIKNQSPDDRASVLLPCIVHYCSSSAETIKNYFDKLFDICDKVYYQNKEFTKEQNVRLYWEGAVDSGWGTLDSSCWMETHDSLLESKDVYRVLDSIESLKAYLFGEGSYAMGDRAG